ncbi:male-enhanced antigen 1 isoform X2 [Brachionichthys hirsutus]|uniref:male-enhanced antigen 1 isoform X2 n=1 Tax=Brachionichthys hirsutus TaxID=412623 RepID=UPI003604CD6C
MEAMGPERVLPNSEDELGEDERPADGALPVWNGGETDGEEEMNGDEEENNGGYYYQPLDQEPGEEGEEEAPAHTEQLQHRLEVMGLHLPEAPPPDSDEEDDAEGAAAQRSQASIPMDADHVELVKRTMAAMAFPSLGVPSWAAEISDDQWKDMVQNTLQSRQSAAALRLARQNDATGP